MHGGGGGGEEGGGGEDGGGGVDDGGELEEEEEGNGVGGDGERVWTIHLPEQYSYFITFNILSIDENGTCANCTFP